MKSSSKPAPRHRVFVSYAASDEEHAHKLMRLLTARSDVTVFSADELSAGENWKAKLRKELQRCDLFSLVLTPSALASDWVLQELGAAWGLEKPIISVVSTPNLRMKLPLEVTPRQITNIENLQRPEDLDAWFEPAA